MGLKSDINDAFLKNIDKDDVFDDNQKKSIQNLIKYMKIINHLLRI